MRASRVWVGLAVFGVLSGLFRYASAADEVKVGVIAPLTGSTADLGKVMKMGYDLALEKINKQGGVLGRPLKLVYEDTRNDAATAIGAIERLVNSEKVAAIMGGYNSTVAFAFLNVLKRYKVPFIAAGVVSPKIEETYGKERWFFHVSPWAYHYQTSMRDFFLTIRPRPKIAMVYEDGLFGSVQAKYARKYFQDAGLQIVGDESFKAGSTDFTPLITRLKGVRPDIFYWIGYTGDSILFVKQSKELDFTPKLFADTYGVGVPQFADATGPLSEFVVGLDPWAPELNYPASAQHPVLFPDSGTWRREFKAKYGDSRIDFLSVVAYVETGILAQAIERAKGTQKERIIEELERADTMTPLGPFKFKATEGTLHQVLEENVVFQLRGGRKVIVWPEKHAKDQLVYPAPAWRER